MDLKGFFKEKKWKKWKKDQWLIVFLAGVLVLIIALPTSSGNESKENDKGSKSGRSQESDLSATEDGTTYETQLEARLEAILEDIDGVGKTQVMITLRNNGEAVVEKDKESSSSSTTGAEDGSKTVQQQSSETTIYQDESDDGGPFISAQIKPEVEGVLVVAQGGGNGATAQNISDAVQALFNIEVHKIKIVKMNVQEEP